MKANGSHFPEKFLPQNSIALLLMRQRDRRPQLGYLQHAYNWLLDATSGGELYQGRWMRRLGIPMVPAWTVHWLFALRAWWRRR